MSELSVSSVRGRRKGVTPTLPDGAVVTGVTTSTSFAGNLTGNVTGIATGNVTGNVTGNISGTTGSFTGNVSVGGTLTYEDVTNVDSVGVITARDGIKVGAGQSISAVSGTITYYGDGSQLEGVQSGTSDFVASGTIANGATVIINTDGTVSAAATIGIARTFSTTRTQFTTNTIENVDAAYDTAQDKIVLSYKDSQDSSKGKAVVGDISGSTITFGTPVTFNNATTSYSDIAYHAASGKIVIAYRDDGNSDYAKAIVGTVDGSNNSISFGSETTFDTNTCSWPRICYDANRERCVIAYSQSSNYAGKAVVVDVSGTTPTFGTIATFNGADGAHGKDIVYDAANQRVVIYFKDPNNSSKGRAIVGTVSSGTDISFFQNAVDFESGAVNSSTIRASYDSDTQKTVVVYQDEGDSNYGKAIVGTISGSGSSADISFGTAQTFSAASTLQMAVEYAPDAQKTLIVYNTSGVSKLKEATISGTDISFGDVVSFAGSDDQEYPGMVYDPDEKSMFIGFKNNTGGVGGGSGFLYDPPIVNTNLTSENYIGIAAEAISDGATGKINIPTGINQGQTGLTTARTYYVQNDGTLSTSAGSPSVVAGKAISSTKILVQ